MAISIKGTYDIKQYRNGEVIYECTQSNLIPNEAMTIMNGEFLGKEVLCWPYKNDYTPSITDTFFVDPPHGYSIMRDSDAGGVSTYDPLQLTYGYDIYYADRPTWIIDQQFSWPNNNNITLSNKSPGILFHFSNNLVINGFVMFVADSFPEVIGRPNSISFIPDRYYITDMSMLSIIKLNSPIPIAVGDSIGVIFSITGACT